MVRDIPDRWVVFRASAMGDVALITGVLSWWHRTREMRFTVVTRAALAPLLAGHPAVDEVIAVTQDEINGHAWWRKSATATTAHANQAGRQRGGGGAEEQRLEWRRPMTDPRRIFSGRTGSASEENVMTSMS